MNKTLQDRDLKELFIKSGALLEGHFLLSSGLHSNQYMQCAILLSNPEYAQAMGRQLAERVAAKPDLVLSPAMGGIIIGHEVARALAVPFFFTERDNGVMTLRRGFALKPGQKIVIVEDVVTTGKSSGEVVAVAQAARAEVVGLLSIVDRTSEPPSLNLPFSCLLKINIASFKPEDCPLCRKKIPVVKPGSRKQ